MQAASESFNMTLLGHHDLAGRGNGGEGLGLHAKNGKRYFYIAHERGPVNFSILDVTNPRDPKLVKQTELATPGLRSNSLSIWGDLMAVAYQFPLDWVEEHGMGGIEPGVVGVELFSLERPEDPRSIGFFDTAGPHSIGTHYVWLMDDKHAYISTGTSDFVPTHEKDHQFPVILDISQPTSPKEAGRWWLPGTRQGDDAPPPARHPLFDSGYRSHNINVYPERPDRAYVGYLDAGVVILDISDKSRPVLAGRLDMHPPMPGFTHTVVPLLERNLLVSSDETGIDHGEDHPKSVWLIDCSVEDKLIPLSTLPMAPHETFAPRAGKFGPHNVHENDPTPTSLRTEDTVYAGFMNAGVRVFDVSDPFRPVETAHFVPPAPPGSPYSAVQINDLYVDENRVIYAIDRFTGGLYLMECTD